MIKNYIIVDECGVLDDFEVLARCDLFHVKATFNFNKRTYPNANIKVYKEVVL